MHHFRHGRFVFNFNSDMSGDVHVSEYENENQNWETKRVAEMQIPGEAFLEFVANYVRGRMITKLEKASTEEILGIDGVNR